MRVRVIVALAAALGLAAGLFLAGFLAGRRGPGFHPDPRVGPGSASRVWTGGRYLRSNRGEVYLFDQRGRLVEEQWWAGGPNGPHPQRVFRFAPGGEAKAYDLERGSAEVYNRNPR